eukprot:scaffold227873_cov39-Tisochrysis_lutea.AAC.1
MRGRRKAACPIRVVACHRCSGYGRATSNFGFGTTASLYDACDDACDRNELVLLGRLTHGDINRISHLLFQYDFFQAVARRVLSLDGLVAALVPPLRASALCRGGVQGWGNGRERWSRVIVGPCCLAH